MVKQVILFCFSLLIFGRIVSWQTIINQTQRDFHRRLNNTRPTLCMHNKDWSGYVTRMTGCADRYHKCIKKKRRANILGLRNVMFPTRSSSTAESQMWGTASPSSGLFWSWMGGALVASSCWEFWVECALEYPSWRKSRGLLSALTSQTAPGNALHSSSWQLLGHFQKGWGKNTAGLFSGAFGTREWREPKGWDWKHMAAWEYLWL